ncbi:hypothetical protein D3C78_1719260 [compost metagenome]
MRDLVAALARCGLRPGIRRLADVKRVRARGVDANNIAQTRVVHQMAKHALCARRATDIAHANEKYLGHHGSKCAGKPEIRQAFFANEQLAAGNYVFAIYSA